MTAPRPLDGIKVLEVGQLLAGPFTGTFLGYFGAEVIKVEPPGKGDPIREWRLLDDKGTSFWWQSLGRNKKSVTANLRSAKGREVVAKLAKEADVLIENFKPGTMEKWGLGPDDLEQENPNLIYVRVSGYGQTGPYSKKPGYASVTEAFSGFRYLNGFEDRPPVRPNLSMGDTVAGLHAVLGVLMALLERKQNRGTGGQVIDVALYESMFNLMEGVLPEFDGAGAIREPSGSTLTGIVPTNTYLCSDNKHVVIGANGDSIYVRLMNAIGRTDLANDPKLSTNSGRVENQLEIDDAIAFWTNSRASTQVMQILEDAEVPVGLIYNIKDMLEDPHYQSRDLFEEVEVDGSALKIPAILPKLSKTPGRTNHPGPRVGSSTMSTLKELGYTEDQLNSMKNDGDI
ncbi:MAG: CaiB/BaiF CoA transferase family protein [Candidatus Azotimanducaceae bacterium]